VQSAYLVEQLVNGLATGSIYALIALGYAMVYSILYLINFAHGDVIMFGAFCALTLLGMAFPVPAAVLAACIAGACIALAVERLAYRPVREANRLVPMISALGAGLVLATLAHLIWGPEVQPFPQLIPRGTLNVFGIAIPQQAIAILALSAALVIAASLLLERTRLGRATKCVCQDLYAAQLMGIPVNVVIPMVYALGGFLGVAGGVLFAMYFNAAFIQMGLLATTKAWAAAMLGGVGNFYGAALGGLLLGVAEMLAVVTIGSAYKDGVALAIIVAVLLLRPQGLFGGPAVNRS
jgi:branched-chain amino acid transport system permease protein